MTKIRITRTVDIPDPLRISRYRKNPELGPKVLFFSGGSAINSLCRTLKDYTHNSIHLVTPFDSGGSSAELRRAFAMPAIGDLRNRLLALADESLLGHPDVYQLFNFRLPTDKPQKQLWELLQDIASGRADLIANIPNPMRQLIRNQLGFCIEALPAQFNLRGASIGNLILAGGYLNNHQHLDPIIFLFSKLVNVLGTVRAIVNRDLHLGAHLEDGSCLIGQHLLSGKEVAPITSPIQDIFLNAHPSEYQPGQAQLRKKNRKLIQNADLICYPPGSFYSSLMANLLPEGVGTAIANNDCPKIYIPNLGHDPEQVGMSFEQVILRLLEQLKADSPAVKSNGHFLNFVLIDSNRGEYPWHIPVELLTSLGITLVDTHLVSDRSAPYYDEQLLVSALLSFT
ncbi:GAK system CofD-like protein [Ketobacter sp.]|uniref:GAK system CofD-like protein n=1 Tax=Ketobacter sp. TaxID=2083498 RepID=UPI000F100AFB|nr:GAK system CofD-like protein [Ketobacter sp.]RLT95054.1 MAG: GAK system CofD-like protein [Ketobacter sp.]